MSNIDAFSALHDKGEVRIGLKLSDEQIASLEALNSSPHWKVYRDVLIAAKSEYFNSILPKTETNDIVKHIGIVAGINFSVVSRIMALAKRIGITKDVAVTGGVALNDGLVAILEGEMGFSVLVPEEPQMVTALGAAIIARENIEKGLSQ